MEWIIEYWAEITLLIMVLDKIVAATPVKWDNLILTSIKSVLSTIKPKV
jgi:hypothetical protein